MAIGASANLKIEIDDGGVVINSAYVLSRGENSIVLGFDCRTKYPQLVTSSDGQEPVFSLAPKSGWESAEQLTDVSILSLPEGDWRVIMPDSFRYEVIVCLWRPTLNTDEPHLWDRSDTGDE